MFLPLSGRFLLVVLGDAQRGERLVDACVLGEPDIQHFLQGSWFPLELGGGRGVMVSCLPCGS